MKALILLLLFSAGAHADMFDGGCYNPNHNLFINQKIDAKTYGVVIPALAGALYTGGVTVHAILRTTAPVMTNGFVGFKVRRLKQKVKLTNRDGFDQMADVWEQCNE